MFLAVIDLLIIASIWLIFQKYDWFIIVFLVAFVILLIKICNLHFVEFENSGLVVSIRKRHLLKVNDFVFPILEFPLELLKDSNVKSDILYLSIINNESESNKTNLFKVNLSGFKKDMKTLIVSSLQGDQSN